MSNKEDQEFTPGHDSKESEQIPVVEDSKYQNEGMDAVDDDVKDSDAQLGISEVKARNS
jgi:hypothetical protein